MRFVLAVVVVLVVGLLLEGLVDSAVGAWAAVIALFTLVALKLVGRLGSGRPTGPTSLTEMAKEHSAKSW